MKKLVILFIISLFTSASFSQDLTNQFYFRLGYSSPSWSQFGLSEQEWNTIGFENKGGAAFELGNIFMFRNILNDEKMALGINVDYLYFIYHTFNTDNQYLDITLGTGRIGSKIGPSFTFSPVKKLAFDLYAKADFAWASGTTMYEEKIGNADDYFYDYFCVGFSGGLNIRYGLLILGVEYNTISPELESGEIDGVYLQNIIDEMADKNNTGNMSKLPCFNFTIGMTF